MTPAILTSHSLAVVQSFHLRMSKSCDLILINKVRECHPYLMLCDITLYWQTRDIDPWCQLDKTNGCTREVHMAERWGEGCSCSRTWYPEPKSGIYPTASQNSGPQPYHWKKENSSSKLKKVQSQLSLRQASK